MKRQHQRHSVEPWLDGGVFQGSDKPLQPSASRSSRNIIIAILLAVARYKGRGISFRIARVMSCLRERATRHSEYF
ncbi:MAG TPA: hypothetical protein DEP91_07145 [Sphingomonas bacterium]|uniref:Uncharacterized protein n=1 Tax=Sphingomonas bacterium TaxID=1895847 RepID=A0A3D0WB09_9SPHN|nr:hypothetical protein [Sphingomonas bacterium]